MSDIRAFLAARWDAQRLFVVGRIKHAPTRTVYLSSGQAEQVVEGVGHWQYVLDDLAAKRSILTQHAGANGLCGRCVERWDYYHDGCEDCADEPHEQPIMYVGRPCPTVLALAHPFRQHPDFDPAWKIEL